MKALSLILVLALAGSIAKAQTRRKAVAPVQKEQSARDFLRAYMRAYGDLSRTRNLESVAKFLSKSFTAVNDGVRGDYESTKSGWNYYLERLNRGEQINHSMEL